MQVSYFVFKRKKNKHFKKMASFVGKKYKLDKSENFDEYMKELGKCSSRIKKHELESSKKCYVNWWQMPCKEVAKRREQRV